MDDDRPQELDRTGAADEAPGTGASDRSNPLAQACEQLNFAHSLVSEATSLRGRLLDVLTDLGTGREQAAARLERSAAGFGPGVPQERLLDAAARARANLGTTQRRWQELAALDIGAPRPTV